MTIDYSRYPENWKEISLRIRTERAGNRCEWCGAVNHEPHPITKRIVTLTVHHIGIAKTDGTPGDRHDKMDVREENLVALCQRDHWIADLDIHIEKAQAALKAKRLKKITDSGQLALFSKED